VEEVAEIVSIPENTVKTRLCFMRAKKLAELLKAAGCGARLAMMATSKKILEQEPSEVENAVAMACEQAPSMPRDARRVDEALARDPALAKTIRRDPGRIRRKPFISTKASARRPPRAMQKLFAAIDGEPARKPVGVVRHLRPGSPGFFREALTTDAGLVGEPGRAFLLLLQAGVIGAGADDEAERPRSRRRR